MPQLHETRVGQKLIEVTLPKIADELAMLNANLAALIELLREHLTTPGTHG